MSLRRPLLVCLILASCLRAAGAVAASWEDEKREWEKLSAGRFYKDPGYAAKLSLTPLPIDNGHFYVGDVGKGIWFSVGETASLAAAALPFLQAQARSRRKDSPVWTDGMAASAAAGVVSYVALKVWSAYDAAASARRYNAAQGKAEGEQGFRWGLSPDGIYLTRRWSGR